MKTQLLVFKQCPNTGELGLAMEHTNSDKLFVATEGTLVAHDIVEHNGVDSLIGIDNELEALGAAWWIRGAMNDIRRDSIGSAQTPIQHFASDIAHMALQIVDDPAVPISNVPCTRSCVYDADFNDIIRDARRLYAKEISYVNNSHLRSADQYFDSCLDYLRSGFRKATRRYNRLGQHGANRLFRNMVGTVNLMLRMLEYPGQQVKLMYCLTTAKVYADIIDEEL